MNTNFYSFLSRLFRRRSERLEIAFSKKSAGQDVFKDLVSLLKRKGRSLFFYFVAFLRIVSSKNSSRSKTVITLTLLTFLDVVLILIRMTHFFGSVIWYFFLLSLLCFKEAFKKRYLRLFGLVGSSAVSKLESVLISIKSFFKDDL